MSRFDGTVTDMTRPDTFEDRVAVGGDVPPDRERVDALVNLKVLDTPPEETFDRITRLAARLLNMPISLVSLVDENRQWFKSKFGLEADWTEREISFCTYAIEQPEPLVVTDALADPRFMSSPLVMGAPHIRFYAGAPLITADGHAVGTLCVIDDKPRPDFGDEQRALLSDLAGMVVERLEIRRVMQALRDEVAAHRRTEEALRSSLDAGQVLLREIHHRVKNNLQAIASIVQVESVRMGQGTAGRKVLDSIGERIAVMFRIHQTLYTTEELDRIDVGHQICQVAERLLRLHDLEGRVDVDARCEPFWLDSDTALRVGLIANELIDNALRHGFLAGSRGTLSIFLEAVGAEDDRGLRLTIEDRGGQGGDADDGVGLLLVRALAQQLEAAFTAGPGEDGWRAVLDMPMARKAA